MNLSRAEEQRLIEMGATITHAKPIAQERHRETTKKPFVEAGIVLAAGRITIVLPTETRSESNQRDWHGRAKRTKSARRILFDFMGPKHAALTHFVSHFHSGGALQIKFTRLGGQRLDDDNLRSSMKATRDAVASMMLADDGDSRFHWRYEQEPWKEVGIRIEIETF